MSKHKKEKELNIDLEHIAKTIANSAFEKDGTNKKKERLRVKGFSFFAYVFSILAVLFIANTVNNLLILSSVPSDLDISKLNIDLPDSFFGFLGIPACVVIFSTFMLFRLRVLFVPMLLVALLFTFMYSKINRVDFLTQRYEAFISEINKEDEGKSIFYKKRNMNFIPIKETYDFKVLEDGMKHGDESVYEDYRKPENQSKLIQISASNKYDLEKSVYRSGIDVIIKDYEKINSDGVITVFEFNEFAKKYIKK